MGSRRDGLRVSGLGPAGAPRRRARSRLAPSRRGRSRRACAHARGYALRVGWDDVCGHRLLRARAHGVPGLRPPRAAGRRSAGGGRGEAVGSRSSLRRPHHVRPCGGSRPHRLLGRRRAHPPRDRTRGSRPRRRGGGARGPASAPPCAGAARTGRVRRSAARGCCRLRELRGHPTSSEHHTTSTTTTAVAPKPQKPLRLTRFPDFRIAMDEATDYLDPGLSDTTEGWGVMWNVYLPLLGYRHANGRSGAKLVPYLATSLPQISRDKRTYRLTLRKGLRYSNGQPVKASDFKETVERDFRLDSAGAGFFRQHRRREGLREAAEGADPRHRRRRPDTHDPDPPRARHRPTSRTSSRQSSPRRCRRARRPRTPRSTRFPRRGRTRSRATGPGRGSSRSATRTSTHALFQGNVPAGNPDRVTWDIVPTATVASAMCSRARTTGWATTRSRASGSPDDRAEVRGAVADLDAAEPHVLLHEHARGAVHEPQGAASRELRDLAALAQAPRRRPRAHDREHPAAAVRRRSARTPCTGTTCARRPGSSASRATEGSASSSGTTTSPRTGRSRSTSSPC